VVDFNSKNNLNANESDKSGNKQNHSNDKKDVYEVKEVMPSYTGGMEALQKFLETNLKYPEEAKKAGINGKVYVSFIISAEGQVKDAKIMRSPSPVLNDESLRLTNSMKDWNPGSLNGKKQSMAVTMPIEFKLK
jgi:TonB family protein